RSAKDRGRVRQRRSNAKAPLARAGRQAFSRGDRLCWDAANVFTVTFLPPCRGESAMPRPWLLRTVVVWLALIAWPAGGGQAGEEHTLRERKHAFRLQARRVDEKLFSQDTRSFAVEVFLEPKTRSWLFVGEGGQALAAAPAVKQKTPGKGQVI